jgi:hypothetical protein
MSAKLKLYFAVGRSPYWFAGAHQPGEEEDRRPPMRSEACETRRQNT